MAFGAFGARTAESTAVLLVSVPAGATLILDKIRVSAGASIDTINPIPGFELFMVVVRHAPQFVGRVTVSISQSVLVYDVVLIPPPLGTSGVDLS